MISLRNCLIATLNPSITTSCFYRAAFAKHFRKQTSIKRYKLSATVRHTILRRRESKAKESSVDSSRALRRIIRRETCLAFHRLNSTFAIMSGRKYTHSTSLTAHIGRTELTTCVEPSFHPEEIVFTGRAYIIFEFLTFSRYVAPHACFLLKEGIRF